jgi:hypothetical protein
MLVCLLVLLLERLFWVDGAEIHIPYVYVSYYIGVRKLITTSNHLYTYKSMQQQYIRAMNERYGASDVQHR